MVHTQLHDAGGDLIRMTLLLIGMLQELSADPLTIDPRYHEIVATVTQYTNDLRSDSFIKKFQHDVAVSLVSLGHRTVLSAIKKSLLLRSISDQQDVRKPHATELKIQN